MTADQLRAEIDRWWDRLSKERPLTGRESSQLQHFLFVLKGRVQ